MSKEIPYSPMGKRKRVSHERMLEVLAKHAPKADEVKANEVPVSDPVIKQGSSPAKRMRWRKREGYENVAESDVGYTVTHCLQTGRYIAFCGRTTATCSPVVLGGYDTPEEARGACDAHYAKHMEASAA